MPPMHRAATAAELRKKEEEATLRLLEQERLEQEARDAKLARQMQPMPRAAAAATPLYDELRKKVEDDASLGLIRQERLEQEARDAELARQMQLPAAPARPKSP